MNSFKKYLSVFLLFLAFGVFFSCKSFASEAEKNEILLYRVQSVNSTQENGYRGKIIGTGVRFRSSPYILSSNIIRTFSYGEQIWVYQSGINAGGYHDGYWWSYVQDSRGTWGYVASKYFATTGGGAQDSIILVQ